MTEAEFRNRRRQQFLTEKYFRLNTEFCAQGIRQDSEIDKKGITPDNPAYAHVFGSIFRERLHLLKLDYTAGEPIESLNGRYSDLCEAVRQWYQAKHRYSTTLSDQTRSEIELDASPLDFESLQDFQYALDAVSVGLLLGRGDGVRVVVKAVNSERDSDMLFEDIVTPAVDDPREPDEFWHELPYGKLVDAVFTANTPVEAAAYVKDYLEHWYESFEGLPWHNGHLVVTDEYSNYQGYWAFEAAAVCVLHGIDDSSFRDHLVYPKDLADWARANNVLAAVKPGSHIDQGTLRCAAGDPCPREGYWLTPAADNSRRHFRLGETMPAVGGDYGATIWQWAADQSE